MEDLEMSASQPSAHFWADKRVLVTGHTGFKGSWLVMLLRRLGASSVTGISLPPTTSPNLYSLADIDRICDSHFCDIRDLDQFKALVRTAAPDVVFHLAAQPLVRASYRDPVATFATNVMGTVNVLESLRDLCGVKVAVMITTDKVYDNHEWSWPYRESDALGGHDPYSASKACSEMVINSYRDAFLASQGVRLASARAGNVIGGGDWSEDRLLPDAVRAWLAGRAVTIRHPRAIRPWQHVLDPLAGYVVLAERLWETPTLAGAFNFGPQTSEAATVGEVLALAQRSFGTGEVIHSENNELHEAGRLSLETAKTRELLGVQPRWGLRTSVARTMHWYRLQAEGTAAAVLCEADISAWEAGP